MIYIKTDKGNIPVISKPVTAELTTAPDKYRLTIDGDLMSIDEGFNFYAAAPNIGDKITLPNGNYWERVSPGLYYDVFRAYDINGVRQYDMFSMVVNFDAYYGYGFIVACYPWDSLLYINDFVWNRADKFENNWASVGNTPEEYKEKSDKFIEFVSGALITDPYEPGGYSGEGGGSGTFSDAGTDVTAPTSSPSLSAAASGMITLYQPTSAQLSSLASYLWTSTFIDVVKKLIVSPLDAIVSLAILPITAPVGAAQEIHVGSVGTGVNAAPITSAYVFVDCGTINAANVTSYYDSALDHEGYTKYSLYLPYIGTRSINADDIAGKNIHVKYQIDILTGACVAYVECGGKCLYQFSGMCAVQIPITGRDFGGVISAALSIAAMGAGIASGGLSTPVTAGMVASGGMTLANNVINNKPRIERSGSMGGASGLMGIQVPYLIKERPRQSLAQGYNTIEGYPSNIGAVIGTLTGFTKVEKIHLENIPATDAELSELEDILKGGFII